MPYSALMHRECKPRCGMALGGIGAGWFEIRQDGATANWNIFNNNPLGCGPLFDPQVFTPHSMLFFVAKWQHPGEEPRMKLLQIEEGHGAAAFAHHEMQYIFPWMTGVDTIVYRASFPFANLVFSANDMPFEVELDAWSPFIPFDEKNSSLPGAFFDFRITSKSDRPLIVTLAASQRNAVAYDRPERFYTAQVTEGNGYRGFIQSVGNVEESHISFGDMGLVGLSADTRCYLGWEHPHPYYERFLAEDGLPEVDDVEGRNKVDEETGREVKRGERFWSTAAVRRELEKGRAFDHSFVVSWDFPNHYARDVRGGKKAGKSPTPRIEGHYYSNFFSGSAQSLSYLVTARGDLKARSLAFQEAYRDSDAPEFVLDQVNSHLNTMFTSSWFSREGHFGILEGLSPVKSFAGLSTTDVAMYGSVMYASLFPRLARQVDRDYARFQRDNGPIAHSISGNFGEISEGEAASPRLDLHAQHAFMSLRDAFWSQDGDFLRDIYPSARKAVEYALRERDRDGDGMPDMEGVMCSYDNFPMFGVAAYVAGQYILAFRTLAEAARMLGHSEDEGRYLRLCEEGERLFEKELWNGRYFRLYKAEAHGGDPQMAEGCLTDQLIGKWGAHLLGLGHLFDPGKVRTALRSVIESNYRPWQGLRNCQWPHERFFHEVDDDVWVDQANTCWTGVELGFAAFCIYEGLAQEGLKLVRTVDERYRKNGMYFDHQEFGGHYFRPMSAWSLINAMAGLGVGAGEYAFVPKLGEDEVKLFFAVPECYGHLRRAHDSVEIKMASGKLELHRLSVEWANAAEDAVAEVDGVPRGDVSIEGHTVCIDFGETVKAGRIIIRNKI